MTELQQWEQDKALYLFTSLTAGSSHVITATSRIETILKNARIPFTYIDTATNESAKKLFQRRGKGKKLPFLVKEGFVIGDLQEVEDWNEFGELKEAIGPVTESSTSITTTPAKQPLTGSSGAPSSLSTAATPSKAPSTLSGSSASAETKQDTSSLSPSVPLALRQAAFESASAAKDRKAASLASTPAKPDSEAALPSPSKIPLPMSPGVPSSGEGVTRSFSGATQTSITSNTSTSSKPFIPEHFDPPPMQHRGSSMSQASEEEIKDIEKKLAIPEEDEEDEEEAIVTDSASKSTQPAKTEDKPAASTSAKDTSALEPVTEEKSIPSEVKASDPLSPHATKTNNENASISNPADVKHPDTDTKKE